MKTSIYICADSTLTYGPYGGRKKIIKQALPVAVVDSPEEAETLITLVGKKTWHPRSDPDYRQQLRGRPIQPGYGPSTRMHYSLSDFAINDVTTTFEVRKTFDLLVAGKISEAFERAHQNPAETTNPDKELSA